MMAARPPPSCCLFPGQRTGLSTLSAGHAPPWHSCCSAPPPAAAAAGLTRLRDLNLQGCRNLANPVPPPLHAPDAAAAEQQQQCSLPGLAALTALTALCLRGCDRLGDGALGFATALGRLQLLDLSGCKELTAAGLAPLGALSQVCVWGGVGGRVPGGGGGGMLRVLILLHVVAGVHCPAFYLPLNGPSPPRRSRCRSSSACGCSTALGCGGPRPCAPLAPSPPSPPSTSAAARSSAGRR